MSLIAVSLQTHPQVTVPLSSLSGTDNASQEFKGRTVSWLFAGPFAAEDQTDADVGDEGAPANLQGHGTCMASIAMGNKDGVARKASLTVVRSDTSSKGNDAIGAEIYVDALAQVYEDVIKNKLKSKAVVSMSIGVGKNADKDYEGCYATAMTRLLLAFEEQDVPAVAAVSNEGTAISAYPALLVVPAPNRTDSVVPNLVVVSGARLDGNFDSDIRDPEIRIYGPSADESGGGNRNPGLECASLKVDVNGGYHKGEEGISHGKSDISHNRVSVLRADSGCLLGTAAVSGMLAYFMGLGKTGSDSRDSLYNIAVRRITNGPLTLYNGLDGTA